MSKYDDYHATETAAGREPMEAAAWRKMRLQEGREKAALAKVQAAAERAPGETAPLVTAVTADTITVDVDPDPHEDPELVHVEPEPEPESTTMTFWSENKTRVEIMQAGGRTVIDGAMAIRPHIIIEFIEHHVVLDMLDPDDALKAEWLLHCKALRKGEIRLVPEIRPVPRVQVQSGPRTTLTPKARPAVAERPESSRDVAARLSAPLPTP